MDWTEPPTDLNAMGIYSCVLIYGEGQRDVKNRGWWVFGDKPKRCGGSYALSRRRESGSEEIDYEMAGNPMPRSSAIRSFAGLIGSSERIS